MQKKEFEELKRSSRGCGEKNIFAVMYLYEKEMEKCFWAALAFAINKRGDYKNEAEDE